MHMCMRMYAVGACSNLALTSQRPCRSDEQVCPHLHRVTMRAMSGSRRADIGALLVLLVLSRALLLVVSVWRFVRATIGTMNTRVYLPRRVAWREAEEVV